MKGGKNKIGFLCSSKSYGGLEINFLLLGKWLTDKGFDIVLFLVKDSPLYQKAKDTGIEIITIEEHMKYFDLFKARKFYNILTDAGVRILQTSHTRDLNFSSLVKRISKNKIKIVHQQQMQTGIRKKNFVHRFTYSKIDCWISPLKMLAEQTLEKTTLSRNQIAIIPLCINTAKFFKKDENAREILNLPKNGFIYGVIGRIDRQKRQDYALRAFAKVKNKDKSFLLFVGETTRNEDDGYFDELRNLAKTLNISDRIIYRDFMDDVEKAFSAINCFILTTPTETYGMVTLEAMASRVPVLASDSGGTVEILENGKCGLLYNFLSIEDLARKMERIFVDEELRNELVDKAYKRVTENFDYKIETDLYARIYKNLT